MACPSGTKCMAIAWCSVNGGTCISPCEEGCCCSFSSGLCPEIDHVKLIADKSSANPGESVNFKAEVIFDEPASCRLDYQIWYSPYGGRPELVKSGSIDLVKNNPVKILYSIESDKSYCTWVYVYDDGNTDNALASNLVCIDVKRKPVDKSKLALAGLASLAFGYIVGSRRKR